MAWWDRIKTKEDYVALVSTGMAWEVEESLPLTWSECEDFLKKKEYYDSVKVDNYKASCKLEGK